MNARPAIFVVMGRLALVLFGLAACGGNDADPPAMPDAGREDAAPVEDASPPDAMPPPPDDRWLDPGHVDLSNPGGTPMRMQRGPYTIVWLSGSPYEMGLQHAQLLHDELAEGLAEVHSNPLLAAFLRIAQRDGLIDLARSQSYPEILEECEGLAAGASDIGFGIDECLLLNFGDVLVEYLRYGTPEIEDLTPGCTQIVANGEATRDGHLYHARMLDWMDIGFILRHPVIFVRRPTGGIPHVVVGFPANLSAYTGMNAEGVVVASNETHPRDNEVHDRTGRSHVQMVSRLLATARSLEDAETFLRAQNHITLEQIVVSHGDTAKVFELAPTAQSERPLDHGLVWAVNHFVGDTTANLDLDPAPEHSSVRAMRLEQLLGRDAEDTLYGRLDPDALVRVLRDRVDAESGVESAADVFEDGRTLATNGSLFAVVFDPAALRFWVAAGGKPVPTQPFVGYSLRTLLDSETDLVDTMR